MGAAAQILAHVDESISLSTAGAAYFPDRAARFAIAACYK